MGLGVLVEGDGLVLVDVEGVEQFLHVLALGGHDLAGERVPHHRDLLEELHEVPQLHVSAPLGQDQPPEPRLLQLAPPQDHPQVPHVVRLRDQAVPVPVDQVEDAADEGVLAAQQAQPAAELRVVHLVGGLAELVEAGGDEVLLGGVEGLLGGRLRGEVPRLQQLLEAPVYYLGLFEFALLPGLPILHPNYNANNIIERGQQGGIAIK